MRSLLELEVFIPSRSRPDRSLTLERLHGKWKDVTLVVPEAQVKQYRALANRHKCALVTCPHNGIARTREYIGTIADDAFIMLDDDLRFMRRASFEDPRLYQLNKTDVQGMLLYVSRLLDQYVHVAIGPRQFNNAVPRERYPWFEIGRPLRALAYRKRPFLSVEHGRVEIMEDFDVTLQLLALGHKNAILTEYVQDQYATQAPGGCSDYRTLALHNRNVERMHALHAAYTRTVEKTNRSGGAVKGGLHQRLELQISWRKAYDLAVEGLL